MLKADVLMVFQSTEVTASLIPYHWRTLLCGFSSSSSSSPHIVRKRYLMRCIKDISTVLITLKTLSLGMIDNVLTPQQSVWQQGTSLPASWKAAYCLPCHIEVGVRVVKMLNTMAKTI